MEYSDERPYFIVKWRHCTKLGSVPKNTISRFFDVNEGIIADFLRQRGYDVEGPIGGMSPYDLIVNGVKVDAKWSGASGQYSFKLYTSNRQIQALRPNGYYVILRDDGSIYKITVEEFLYWNLNR